MMEFHARTYSSLEEQMLAIKGRRNRLGMGPARPVVNYGAILAPRQKELDAAELRRQASEERIARLERKREDAEAAARAKGIRISMENPIHLMRFRPPLWKREQIAFDEHVWVFRRHQVGKGHKVKAYIQARAEQHGLSYAEIIGPSRLRKYTHVRQLIMWEIKNMLRPNISMPEIGRLFGNRDHTTVLHALRRVQALIDTGAIPDPRTGEYEPKE